MKRRPDPRGPHRTIATVESPTDAHVVTYLECGHTGRHTRHHAAPRPGDRSRCYACGVEELARWSEAVSR